MIALTGVSLAPHRSVGAVALRCHAAGRVVCGLIADRVGAQQTLVVGLLVQSVAISLYLFTFSATSFYALSLLFGFAYGGVMPLYPILVREYFGARIIGTVFGVVAMMSTFGMAIGPWAGGWLFDTLGGYFWLYIASCGIGVAAMAIAFTLRPPARLPASQPMASAA
jgi:MFS family permease